LKQVRNIGPLLQMGWLVALSTLVPLGFGIWLDRQLGTAPLFILIGALVGILAATIGATRIASRTIEALGLPPGSEKGSAAEETGQDTVGHANEDTAQ
jgi:F0F1-type ATP synthase assembly protein I